MSAERWCGTALFHGDAQLLIFNLAASRQSQRQDAGNRTVRKHGRIVVAGGQVCRRASMSTPEFSSGGDVVSMMRSGLKGRRRATFFTRIQATKLARWVKENCDETEVD
jgi:hypothetical protein